MFLRPTFNLFKAVTTRSTTPLLRTNHFVTSQSIHAWARLAQQASGLGVPHISIG